jgi:outer membrane protein assembly factor BamB
MNGVFKAMTVTAALSMSATVAADWPGIYGPNRDNTSSQSGLLRSWPAGGPKVLWTARVNAGFGGPAVAVGKVYLLDRDEKVGDALRVLDLATGRQLWTYGYDAPGRFMFAGSRTTPTIDGELVYISGPLGDLHAISTTTQKPVWRTNIWKEFGGGELPRWAVVQNPLVYRDLVIVAPQTAEVGVVAFDKLTGALKWKSAPLSGTAGYVSPAIVKVGDENHVVQVTAWSRKQRGSVNGLDPLTGKVLWSYSGWQCGIPVPQPVDAGQNRILITGGYDAGSAMIQVAKNADGTFAVTELFKNPDFGAHTQPPILFQDHFYAHYTVNNRSDGLVAMTMDGRVTWKTDRQPPFVRGGAILAEGLLLATDGNTKLYLIEPNPTAFKPLASATVLEPGDNWAPLALVDGKLLVRGQKQLKVLQVAR